MEAKALSRRTERVARVIRDVVADAIQNRLQDPRIPPITSVTRVEVTEDFALARIHVSVMASEARGELCMAALRKAAGTLRSRVGAQLRLRKLPVLEFRLDRSLQRGSETVQTLEELMRELGEKPVWERADESDASDAAGAEAQPSSTPRENQPDASDVQPQRHEEPET